MYHENRRLALTVLPHLADENRQVVSGDVVELAAVEVGTEVMIDCNAIAGLSGLAQVKDRAGQPRLGRITETQTHRWRGGLSVGSTRQELVTQYARRHDASVDGPPPLAAAGVFEAHLEAPSDGSMSKASAWSALLQAAGSDGPAKPRVGLGPAAVEYVASTVPLGALAGRSTLAA